MKYILRPYQLESIKAIEEEWKTLNSTLLILPTGVGKTLVFSHIIKNQFEKNPKSKALILAHREELLNQAITTLNEVMEDKNIFIELEQGENTILNKPNYLDKSISLVLVSSIQTMNNRIKTELFEKDFFDLIVIDEAHHSIAQSYQNVLNYFSNINSSPKILGVTATPDRGDLKDLSTIFKSRAYEYSLRQAIDDEWLSPIDIKTIDIKLDISNVRQITGDYDEKELHNVINPNLEKIADKLGEENLKNRKTLIFMPLIESCNVFKTILINKGFNAEVIHGSLKKDDRKRILDDFKNNKINILLNSMLLTEGFDEPSIDTIIVLRPTRSKSLYTQCIGRGTRLLENKRLLILDFLWLTNKFDLCRPTDLISTNFKLRNIMNELYSKNKYDLLELEKVANKELIKLEEKELLLLEQQKILLKELEKTKNEYLLKLQKEREEAKKKRLVDPFQYAISIENNELINYEPIFEKDYLKPLKSQITFIEKSGIYANNIQYRGYATKLIEILNFRKENNFATPKQIRFLENYNFKRVGNWDFQIAYDMINDITNNNWKVPSNVNPETFK